MAGWALLAGYPRYAWGLVCQKQAPRAGTSNTSHRYQVHSTVYAVCDYFPGPRYQLLAHNPHVWVDICLSKSGLIGTCIYIYELTECIEVTLNIQYVAIILNIRHVPVKLTSVNWSRITRICASELGHRWFRWRLDACLVPSHWLNHWLIIHIGISRDKLKWNWKKNQIFSFQENASDSVLSRFH